MKWICISAAAIRMDPKGRGRQRRDNNGGEGGNPKNKADLET
jgi:hypothetical protein